MVGMVFLVGNWKTGRICLHKGQEKIFQVTKKQKHKSKKAQGIFGDSQLTSTDKAKVLLKHSRAIKQEKMI